MRVDADRGLKSVEKFGWGDKTPEVLAMLKHKEARYYLIVTDVNGDEVSIEIQNPKQMTLRSGTSKRPNASNVQLPIVALEVEVPDKPPFSVLENATATMHVEANETKPEPKRDLWDDMLAAKKLLDNDPVSPTYYLPPVSSGDYRVTFPKPPATVDVFYDKYRWQYIHTTTWHKGQINETRFTKRITAEMVESDPGYWQRVLEAPDFGDGPVGRDTKPPS